MAAPSKLSTLKAAKLLGVKVGEGDKAVLKAAYKKAALRVSPRQSSLVPRSPETRDALSFRSFIDVARLAHPDKGGDEAKFVAVSEAYQVLLSAKGKTVRSYDESSSSSDDEYVKDSLSGRIVDPHAMFAAMFGAGPARAAIGDDGYEREMNRSDREVMFAYDVDGCDDVDAWGRYVRRTAGLVYAPERGGRFVLERRGDSTWVLAAS